MYVCMYVCMDGWVDGWMDVCMYVVLFSKRGAQRAMLVMPSAHSSVCTLSCAGAAQCSGAVLVMPSALFISLSYAV